MSLKMYVDFGKQTYASGQFRQAESLYADELYHDAITVFFQCLKTVHPDAVDLHFTSNYRTFQIKDILLNIQGSVTDKYVMAEAAIDFPHQFPQTVMPWMFTKLGLNGDTTVLYFDIPIADASPASLFTALKEIAVSAAAIRSWPK